MKTDFPIKFHTVYLYYSIIKPKNIKHQSDKKKLNANKIVTTPKTKMLNGGPVNVSENITRTILAIRFETGEKVKEK